MDSFSLLVRPPWVTCFGRKQIPCPCHTHTQASESTTSPRSSVRPQVQNLESESIYIRYIYIYICLDHVEHIKNMCIYRQIIDLNHTSDQVFFNQLEEPFETPWATHSFHSHRCRSLHQSQLRRQLYGQLEKIETLTSQPLNYTLLGSPQSRSRRLPTPWQRWTWRYLGFAVLPGRKGTSIIQINWNFQLW